MKMERKAHSPKWRKITEKAKWLLDALESVVVGGQGRRVAGRSHLGRNHSLSQKKPFDTRESIRVRPRFFNELQHKNYAHFGTRLDI